MDDRVMQFRVGVMFLATFLITGILLVLFGKLPTLTGRNYTIQVQFDSAGGVSKDTPVRKSGILIGRVSDVRLTDQDSGVLVTLMIQADKTIYQNEDCYVTRDLLGDTAITFVPSRKKSVPREPVAPNSLLVGMVSEDPTGLKTALKGPIDTVEQTGLALTAASKQLGEAAHRVEDILSPDAQKDVQDILHDAAKALRVMQQMLGDEENQTKLTESLKRLPATLDNMNRTFQATDDTLRRFTERSRVDGKTPVERMVGTIEMTEKTLRKFSEPSAPGKLAPADQIAKAMADVGEVASLVRSVTARIEQGEGSLGALLNDRQLYDHLNHTAKNLEEVSRKLEPIVDDARVITDKIARHPGVIIKDAVKPGPGLK
jgi:phospholipid/cholesterol/gamma-HCH transport system substrate-binding protein